VDVDAKMTRYKTTDGERQSTHSILLWLYP
jgi:hypothetical protein